ncbi:MAG: glutamine--fructose-6-phosphate transaminase (isomerizing) [Clostridia bacterium]|nr:glutamine--fructose-6-phosphate transaminase (isomerizing) [Clostridia bacterium]
MCGIVGYIGTKKAVPVLINGLLSLEYRGYDSAGLAVLNHSSALKIVKDMGRVKNLQNNPELDSLDGSLGIAHTRWATRGAPSKNNSHPHTDNSETFTVVHNGIIENYDELKSFLADNGYTLHTETDTEIIPNLIHYYYSKNSESGILSAVSNALKKLEGSFAIEVISPLLKDTIIVAKKDSPVVIGVGEGENYVASDIPAILSYTRKFYFLEDFEIAELTSDSVKFYDFDLNSINKEIKDIEWDAVASEKNGYDDYMLKEIFEQPTAIRETIGTAFASDDKINLPLDGLDFSKFNKMYIIACGTAMHAGLATKYIFEKFAKFQCEVDMASEFRYRDPLIDEHTLCIFISQSGETADTIAALKLAKDHGSTTISIVNVIGSSITRLSDYVLYTHAGPEIAVASTKAYTCQVTLLSILAMYIAENKGLSNIDGFNELKSDIIALPEKVKSALELSDSIKELAKQNYTKKDMFYIGRITDYAICMEGSLKLKEISYIHSEAYAAGELKHGTIALIEDGTSVIGVITNPQISSKTLSNLDEVVTRGANIILVTNQDVDVSSTNIEENSIIRIPKCSPLVSPVIAVVPLQLFAYHTAKFKELDVDKPRNLAKSVTVE